MIERLPLDIFGSDDDPEAAGQASEETATANDGEAPAAETEAATDIVLAGCHWCGVAFNYTLSTCPACGVENIRIAPPQREPDEITCQWCLSSFDPGPTHCPSCNARVVIPGQYIPGEHDSYDTLTSRSLAARQAHSQQLLAGMMAGGGIDTLFGGLIGLAITLFDD